MRLLRRHVGDGSRPPFRGWSLIEGFASLQAAVDIHQHGFQRVQVEAAQTVSQGVIAKSALGADPVLQMGMGQFTIQLLEAGQATHKTMEESQEDAGRRDFR
ncbi:MAG: hypothetical protein DMG57_33685, partial [Acidobacteria bacterium]